MTAAKDFLYPHSRLQFNSFKIFVQKLVNTVFYRICDFYKFLTNRIQYTIEIYVFMKGYYIIEQKNSRHFDFFFTNNL